MKREFSQKEIDFLRERQYSFNFTNPTDDDWLDLQDWAIETLMHEGFDEDYNATDVGNICEDLIDIANAHLDD